MQLNRWLPFFIQTPVFCEIFFKNISLSTFVDSCELFLLAGDTQMIVRRCCHYSSSRFLQSQEIGRFGHYNLSENRPFFKSLLSKCAQFSGRYLCFIASLLSYKYFIKRGFIHQQKYYLTFSFWSASLGNKMACMTSKIKEKFDRSKFSKPGSPT